MYCECGCGGLAPISPYTDHKMGYRKGEPRQFIRGHNVRRGPKDIEVVDMGWKTPCHIWQRSLKGKYAYGRRGGKSVAIHRWNYEAEVGPIPEGLQLDHLCNQMRCVNPEHLQPVTNAENVRRGFARRWEGAKGLRRWRLDLGLTQTQLAQVFGTHQATVSNWEIGKTKPPPKLQAIVGATD